MTNTTPLIIYHANCADGMTAAWIAKKHFPSAELLPTQYGDDPPDVSDLNVFVLDFSYPRDVMLRMFQSARLLRVLDHHKSAAEACEGLHFCQFDMEKSGASLAWEHFHSGFETPPRMLAYIEDSDLWRFKLDRSQEVRSFVQSFPFTMEAWDELMRVPIDDAKDIGEHLVRYRTKQIESNILDHAKMVDWTVEFGTTLSMVVIQTPIFISDACSMALERFTAADVACAIFRNGNGKWVHSLRSRNGSNVDVSTIAKAHGGGGHEHSAGFTDTELYV